MPGRCSIEGPIGVPSANLSSQPSSQNDERSLRRIAETGGGILRALLEIPQYLPERESSVEGWEGKCRRTDALLSARYALAKGTNRQDQYERKSAKIS